MTSPSGPPLAHPLAHPIDTPIPFVKMHGLGNDFIIIDNRQQKFEIAPDLVRKMSDRHLGIGCDQLAILDQPVHHDTDLFMQIFNQDGSKSGSCGNLTRCVAAMVMAQKNTAMATIETQRGPLECWRVDEDQIKVAMGAPLLAPKDIPLNTRLIENQNSFALDLGIDDLPRATAVGMGNPHCIFMVEDAEAIDLANIGPRIEHHPFFPEKTNVGFVSPLSSDNFRLRVWERGAGLTLACGSNACAAGVALILAEKAKAQVNLHLDGGTLLIQWDKANNQVFMTGTYATSFHGEFIKS